MNLKKLNDDLLYLIELRNELFPMQFNSNDYDEKEQELQDAEDRFNELYGPFLEPVLNKIHTELFPETEVLSPTAYLAKEYIVAGMDDDEEPIYKIRSTEGIPVDASMGDGEGTPVQGRLVTLPSPMRYVLTVATKSIVIWNSDTPDDFNV